MIIINNKNKKDGSGGDYHHHHQESDEDENVQIGRYLPIHSQVMKIKKEFEKVKHPSLQQPEMRRVLHGLNRQRRSRSPLGLPDHHRPISVAVDRNTCRVWSHTCFLVFQDFSSHQFLCSSCSYFFLLLPLPFFLIFIFCYGCTYSWSSRIRRRRLLGYY